GLVGATGTFTAEIWRNFHGHAMRLSQTPVSSGSGVVRFEVVGNSLKLFLDGQLVGYAFDKALSRAGALGVRGSTSTTFASFVADRIVRKPQSLPFSDSFNGPDGSQLDNATWQGQLGNFTVVNNQAQGDAAFNLATVNAITTANSDQQIGVALS